MFRMAKNIIPSHMKFGRYKDQLVFYLCKCSEITTEGKVQAQVVDPSITYSSFENYSSEPVKKLFSGDQTFHHAN